MRILDLFCGAGGAAMGLWQAGFEVVGVDIKPQPHYPFEFYQGDALTYSLEGFDVYWASPPCQGFSVETPMRYRGNHRNLIPAIRERFKMTGKPYVIENVANARWHLVNPMMLCGSMFGLGVWRHRYFEISPEWFELLPHCNHSNIPVLVTGTPRRRGYARKDATVVESRQAMETPWMTKKNMDEAIPPVYSRFIGKYLMGVLNGNG